MRPTGLQLDHRRDLFAARNVGEQLVAHQWMLVERLLFRGVERPFRPPCSASRGG